MPQFEPVIDAHLRTSVGCIGDNDVTRTIVVEMDVEFVGIKVLCDGPHDADPRD